MNHYRKYIKISLLAITGLITLASCKKSFLEIVPKGKLVASTTSDYNLLLNNLDLMNIQTNAQILMGDEIASTETYFNNEVLRSQRLFRWDKDIYDENVDADEFRSPVKALYTYNKIINEVPDSKGGTEQEKKSVEAEARAGRAWLNFVLISQYGKPYNAATAGTDPGFPILTDADVTTTTFTRASVQEMYDFIIKDLNTAIPSLPAKITFRTRMSRAAGEFLLGKVYLFMGKSAEALPLFNAAFADLSGASINVNLYDYNVTMAAGGSFLPIGSSGPNIPFLPNNEESVFARQFGNNWAGYNNFAVLKKETVDLYKPSDLRLKFFSTTAYSTGIAFPNGMMRRLGPGNVQSAVVLPDLYLLRAECKARLNDLAGAVADVEALRSKRMPAVDVAVPPANKADKVSLINYIMEERTREFALTGFRWFDMRRLSVDPLFTLPVYTHTLFLANGGTTTFTMKPERLTLRLPLKVMSYNPGMAENP